MTTPALFWPPTLTSGPESGLCNQLYALIGWFLILNKTRSQWSGMVLPRFTTHDTNGTSVPFAALYDARALAESLWTRVGLTVWDCGQCIPDSQADDNLTAAVVNDVRPAGVHGPPVQMVWRPPARGALLLRAEANQSSYFRAATRSFKGALEGWHEYKHFSSSRNLLMNSTERTGSRRYADPSTYIEEAVYAGLSPSARMLQRVRETKESLGLLGQDYGCLHARIERDMIASWTVNRAGRPPRLRSYMDSLARFSFLHNVSLVFVAVGLDITPEDDRALNRDRTSWGAQLVRSTLLKSMPKRRDGSEHSYTEASLVDLQICRDASWLVGFGGSTFTRVAARSRTDGRWVATCPNSADSRVVHTDEGIDNWSLCPPTNPSAGHVRCSFGLKCD